MAPGIDAYRGWDEEEGDWGDDLHRTAMERAKDIMSMLEDDDELMSNLNFLLRQKKLKQLKNK
jgi:hypothetical protein